MERKQTEVRAIPAEWDISTVGEEFRIELGKMLDAEKNVGVSKPYLANKDVQWGRIDIDNLSMMAMTRTDLYRYRLEHGDLLVCEGGEVGRAAIWGAPIEECYYQKALHRLRPTGRIHPEVMQAFLNFWVDNDRISDYVSQTSIAHLTKEKLSQIPLPVPPPVEQRAITAALSDVDALIAKIDMLIIKKQAIKTATIQRLLTGEQRLPGFSGAWETRRLGDIFQLLSTANNSRADLTNGSEVIYLHYGDIHTTLRSHLDLQQVNLPSIDVTKVQNVARLQNGDLVMVDASEDYEGIGKSVEIYGVADQPAVAGLHTFLLRGDPTVLADHFKGYLQYIPALNSALRRLATGTSVFGISKTKIKDLRLKLPPRDEQAAIANILSDIDAEIETLQARRDKTRAIKQGMMQELLTGKTRLV